MKGQVFTVAKLHYVNGVVYFVAEHGNPPLTLIAEHFPDTTKSGKVQHPLKRVGDLARLAQGIGLLAIHQDKTVSLTDLGEEFYKERSDSKWSFSERQKALLCKYFLSDPFRTEPIYAITSLLEAVKSGYSGKDLIEAFAISIGKSELWKSEVTGQGFTSFLLSYIEEIGLLTFDEREYLAETIANERRYQERVNTLSPISIPDGKLPRPKPTIIGKSEKFKSNPRRSKTALMLADFKCEMDGTHTTFINKSSNKSYMEAHHLIPMSKQGQFEFDIDVPENILSLCPNCHREVHLSHDDAKKILLKKAFDIKKNKLPNRGIRINFDSILSMYEIPVNSI